jgi:hypothetical protein
MGEFEAVTERSAGGENRIPEAQRANGYTEVNDASGAHIAQKDNTKPRLLCAKSGEVIVPVVPLNVWIDAHETSDHNSD